MNSPKPKSALNEVIQNWLSNCMDSRDPPTKLPENLQSDAATFFRYISKNTQVVTESKLVLQTKSSHEEALVQLVQDLHPAFSDDHHRSRYRALHILAGAIGGCHQTYLTNKTFKLLGQFLLVHCGPVNDDDYEEDYDTMIRDISIQALASLLGVGGTSKDSRSGESDEELAETIINRLNFAMDGTTRRCALPETDDDGPDVYGFRSSTNNNNNKGNILGGLSTLPRSKRALCFDLLQQCVNGIAPSFAQFKNPFQDELLYSNLQCRLVDFARFTARCLNGESDPRCLLQLLKLLNSTQAAVSPWFPLVFVSPEAAFPTEDIFDAVAPYFPIQFTPPPNDIHGITREGLHQTLLAVLTFTDIDAGVIKLGHQPMLTLSADLFLETLMPAPGDDNPGPLDKLEALQCLSSLLVPTSDSNVVDLMETRIAVSLSQAIRDTHDEASLRVSQGGQIGIESKRLADSCRTFISKLAYRLERGSRKDLWDIMIQKSLQSLSSNIKRSPSSNKTSIAYVACLTSSGGSRTLRASLAMGLQPLLDVLQHRMADDEDTAAALYGVGAFCSSCQVAMTRAKEHGVILFPHPLDSFSEGIAESLLTVWSRKDLSSSIHNAAVRGVESLLSAGGIDQLSADMIQKLCSFLDELLEHVVDQELDQSGLAKVYASVLGNIIGGILNEEHDSYTNSLMRNPVLMEHVTKTVYPSLLPKPMAEINFSGLHVLSIASELGTAVADPIMVSCLEMLETSLKTMGIRAHHPSGQAVSYLLRHGGLMSTRAFHKSSSLDGIFESLNAFSVFPSKDSFFEDLRFVKNVSDHLLPAFRRCVPSARLQQLLSMISNILPPLSQADNFRICVWLPFLAEALLATQDTINSQDTTSIEQEVAANLVKGLSEILIATEFDATTRSAAGSCLYSVVGLSKEIPTCPVGPIISSSVGPIISRTRDTKVAVNSLRLLALCGSAAACRGGSSSSTADKVARFLLEITSHGTSRYQDGDNDFTLNASAFENELTILLCAASGYGSMLTDSRLITKPLMKQRLIHASSKYIKAAYEAERSQSPTTADSVTTPPPGLLVVASHILCISDVTKLDRTTLHQLSTLVVEGLSSPLFLSESTASTSSKNLVLTAVLKVISLVPTVVNGVVLSIVTGLLRVYAMSDSTSEVSCKLLALQGLECLAHIDGTSTSSIRPAVVAVLAAATNHPSGLLRQASVDVRNAWFVLE